MPCVASSRRPRLSFSGQVPGPYMPLLHHQSPRQPLWFLFSFNSHAAFAGSSPFPHSCTIIKASILATRFELLDIASVLAAGGCLSLQLNERTPRTQQRLLLAAQHVGRGRRVGLLSKNHLVCSFAVTSPGAAFSPPLHHNPTLLGPSLF